MLKFQTVKANIQHNPKLYKVQIDAYNAALAHYNEFKDIQHRESLIVMPTGTGKTGVMSILPFGISNGKVLIITPGKIVSKTVFKSMDSIRMPEQTFWYKQQIIIDRKSLPISYLYQGFNPENLEEKNNIKNKLDASDIIITNVHKIGSSSDEVNLMKLVPEDYFDMIIIDEAHHFKASMWQEALDYFKATKVIKLTATPFRSDKQSIISHDYDLIFEYTLGEAINDGLVKNIVKQEELPGEMEFIDPITNKRYSLEEAKEIVGNEWVSKSVALSETCSKEVIEKTKEILMEKRKSFPKHQVLAVTCNDDHAKNVAQWFNEAGVKASYVSTRSLSEKEIEQRLADFDKGLYDVMVSIQMLGEGYDNPNISIISLFRPFKTLSPYAQAIGRGLRKIHDPSVTEIDNFCNVIYHQELGLEELWEYYKNQENYAEKLKKQEEFISEQLYFDFDELGFVEKKPSPNKKNIENDFEPIMDIRVGKVLRYSSQGIGKEESFTSDGYNAYKNALNELNKKQMAEFEKEISKYRSLEESGILSEEDVKMLIQNKEAELQGKINKTYNEVHDLLFAETLRKDYVRWLNAQVEKFFNRSVLTKEGTEIIEDSRSIDSKAKNNIGYIVKNINQAVYAETGRRISNFTTLDYALAKEIVTRKLKFWEDQYGIKEGLDE